MARCVLLLHETPDGRSHHDWMLERADSDAERSLIAFRIDGGDEGRVDLAQIQKKGRFEAARIENHRAFYLDYQGPISENRGLVSRVAEGACTIEESDGQARIHAECDWWGSGSVRYSGERVAGDRWEFRVAAG